MPEDEFEHVRDILPDAAMPLHAVRIVEFIDANGNTRAKFVVDGDVRIGTVLGTLAIVTHHYQHAEMDGETDA